MATAKEALQLFQVFRASDPSLVFYISRDVDAKFYGYHAVRQGNALIGEPHSRVICRSVICPNWHNEEKIPPLLLEHFFRMVTTPIPNTHEYDAYVIAFKQRHMTLHLKQNSNPDKKHDGHVTSTVTLVLGPDRIEVPNVEIFNIHKFITYDDLGIPDVSRVFIHGCVNKKYTAHLSAALIEQYCTLLSPTQYLITEHMPITPEMRKQFDVASLAKQWLFDTASSSVSSSSVATT